MPAHFENSGILTVKKSLQEFDAKKMYLHPKNRPVSFHKRQKMLCFHHALCSQNVVSKMYRLELRFQNLPFSKSAGKRCVPFSCEREAYPSHFSPFSKCAGIV